MLPLVLSIGDRTPVGGANGSGSAPPVLDHVPVIVQPLNTAPPDLKLSLAPLVDVSVLVPPGVIVTVAALACATPTATSSATTAPSSPILRTFAIMTSL
jgi:hypothetical protein